MELKQLSYEEVKEIYHTSLVQEFPKEECKPLSVINVLMKLGCYECFGLMQAKQLIAYAFVCIDQKQSHLLLDYLCILQPYRNAGAGSTFLNLLKQRYHLYDCLIAEVEFVDTSASMEQQKIQQNRLKFYAKNGLEETNFVSNMFGTKLKILCLPLSKKPEEIVMQDQINEIYDRMYYDAEIRKQIYITKK